MIKLKNILSEIGEGTATPYKFKFIPLKKVFSNRDRHSYRFTTDSKLEYEVDLFKTIASENRFTKLIVMFNVVGGSYSDVTNKGEQFKIMATVIAIIKADMDLIVSEGNPEVKVIEFTPEKSDETDDRRANFYKAYIRKQLPNALVDYSHGEYRVRIN